MSRLRNKTRRCICNLAMWGAGRRRAGCAETNRRTGGLKFSFAVWVCGNLRESGWVWRSTPGTRCEYVRVSSGAASLLHTVPEVDRQTLCGALVACKQEPPGANREDSQHTKSGLL